MTDAWAGRTFTNAPPLSLPMDPWPPIRIYTGTPFRVAPPRQAVITPPAAVPLMPVDRVERYLELCKRSPGLSRRARRRRGERSAILKELAR